MKLGVEVFIGEKKWQGRLENRRLAFLAHNASVDSRLQSSWSVLQSYTPPLKWACVFGPQHGFQGTEQANMVVTEDKEEGLVSSSVVLPSPPGSRVKPVPVWSLYSSHTRRLTKDKRDAFDVLLVDLQDVGCRVYTYLSTLFYVMEDLSGTGKQLWVLDRPNPAGRGIQGGMLDPHFFSFVGVAPLPLCHGMTLGELALWYRNFKNLDLDLEVVRMSDYHPHLEPWPGGMAWVLPSPNMVDLECSRLYGGTVLLEGTRVSEARGTVFPLKAFGFPGMRATEILKTMQQQGPQWLKGVVIRVEAFKPVFDKFQGQVCEALRVYIPSQKARPNSPGGGLPGPAPVRLVSLFLKCLRQLHPEFEWKAKPPYEYEYKKWPIDILSGDAFLRQWVEDSHSTLQDLEKKLIAGESLWQQQRKPYLLYEK